MSPRRLGPNLLVPTRPYEHTFDRPLIGRIIPTFSILSFNLMLLGLLNEIRRPFGPLNVKVHVCW